MKQSHRSRRTRLAWLAIPTAAGLLLAGCSSSGTSSAKEPQTITFAFGATNDLWGRSWLGSDFSNANFRVRVTDVTSQPNKDYYLEYLAVQVTYTP